MPAFAEGGMLPLYSDILLIRPSAIRVQRHEPL